jgi:hypothetical protein
MDELEEVVAALQVEVSAVRKLVTLLLAQHGMNSPNALENLSRLLDETIPFDSDTGFEEGVREECKRMIHWAETFVKAAKGQVDNGT